MSVRQMVQPWGRSQTHTETHSQDQFYNLDRWGRMEWAFFRVFPVVSVAHSLNLRLIVPRNITDNVNLITWYFCDFFSSGLERCEGKNSQETSHWMPWKWTLESVEKQYNRFGLHYVKKSLMSWVVDIPKEGWTFFWYDTDYLIFLFFFEKNFWNIFFSFFFQVTVIPKEGWIGYQSILLLVWQRLRTLGTFWHTTTHLSHSWDPGNLMGI